MTRLTKRQRERLTTMTWCDLKPYMPKLDSLHTLTGERFRCLFPGEVVEPVPTAEELAGMYPAVPPDQRAKALHDDLVHAGRIGHEWPAERYVFGQRNRRDYAAMLLDIGHPLGPCTRHAIAELLRTKPSRGRPTVEQDPLSADELGLAVLLAREYLLQMGPEGLTLAQFERRKARRVRRQTFRAALERVRFALNRAEK